MLRYISSFLQQNIAKAKTFFEAFLNLVNETFRCPSPTAAAKSVLSANSIIVADRPIKNSPASSAFCANHQ
jgi:hypothetical protein